MRYLLKTKIFLLVLIMGFLGTSRCFAEEQINKDLNLVKGYSYLLNFDDKIVRYSLGDSNAAKIELVSSIFNNNQDIILKTLKETNTNLLVWTKEGVYNFNITIIPTKMPKLSPVISEVKNTSPDIATSPIIQNFSKNDKDLPDNIKSELDELSIDTPPHLQNNQEIFGFEIDQPPKK